VRVAAYCRVSTDSDEQMASLEAQKDHYESYIKANPDWEFAGIYYDEGISGTKKENRTGLLRLLADCENKKIDFIITKSVSRFARNTTDCIEMVRKLTDLGVFIYSREEGTAAAKWPSRISQKEKERRLDAIMSEQADISLAVNRSLIGKTQEVLIEEKSDRRGYAFIGRCRRQAPEVDGVTYVKDSNAAIGDFVSCTITGADHYDLYGKMIS